MMYDEKYGKVLIININSIERVKRFSEIANKFDIDMDVMRGRYVCDAKSILAIMSFDLGIPLSIGLITDNQDVIAEVENAMKEFM